MATTLKTKNSVVTTVVPTALAQGELAVNITDKKMWVGNAATTPVQILGAGVTNDAGGSTTQVQYNSSGVLAGSANMTFSGTALTLANDASISGLTVGKGGGAVASNTVLGLSAGSSNTSGAYNTFVGGQDAVLGRAAGQLNTTGSINTALGNGSLASNLTGGNNTAVGYRSLGASTASNNTALGAYSLLANTTGDANVAIGRDTLQSNTTASYNTAVGYQAGYSNTTADNNTFIGRQAGYSNTVTTDNVFIGRQAGYSYNGTGGTYNTFVGTQAGYLQTSGQYNTYIGLQSGYNMTTGARNTIIGSFSGNQSNLDIRTASNYIVLSDGDGNPRIISNGSGEISMNTTPATGYTLTLKGAASGAQGILYGVNAGSTFTIRIQGDGSIYNYYGTYGTISDARLKENIVDATPKLADLMQVKVRNYNLIDDESKTKQIGVIAQELETVFPNMVTEDEDGNKAVKSAVFVPMLIKAIQELKAEFDAYKATHP
jgi:hypothetical protein